MVKQEGVVSQMEVDPPTTQVLVGGKRKSQDNDKTNTTNKKKPYDISGRSPLQAFNDLWHGIEFTFKKSEIGKPSSFQVNAEVEGIRFEGKGTGKVLAKRDLVVKALHKLKGFAPLKPDTPTYPVTTKAASGNNNNLSSGLLDNLPTIDVDKVRSGPAMMLTQVFNEAELTFTEEVATRADKRFKAEMEVVSGRKFYGEGRSKKAARLNLAKTVFLVLYNINDFEVVDETRSSNSGNNRDEDSPGIKKSRFPLTQLKEIVGEDDLKVDMEDFAEDNGDKKFHATVTVKGVQYQAIGESKFTAKVRAAKKALEVVKQTTKFVNAHGVDVGVHPSLAFQQHFPDFPIVETEGKSSTGLPEHNFEVNINKKSYKVSAPGRKKGKLRLILQVFECVKKTAPTEWKNIDLDKVYEDKPVHKAVTA